MKKEDNTSLWTDSTSSMNPALAKDAKVDVAVIGAGYTGLSAAYHIKRHFPDKVVIVLEAEYAGYGASGRNGGMCLNQPSSDYMSMAHPKSHRLTYDATAQSIKEMSEMMRAHGFGDDIRTCGSLLVNCDENGVERSREYANKAASLGIPIEYWDRTRLTEELGTTVYAGGLYDPNAAEVNPMKLVHALKNSVEGVGAAVYENCPVLQVEEGAPAKLRVSGANGRPITVAAEAVVLGANGYVTKLGFFRNRVIVAHTEMAATKRLGDGAISELGWTSRIPYHDDRVYLYYLGTTGDNRITIGGGNAEYYFNDGLAYRKNLNRRRLALKKELTRIYPSMKDIEFEYVWTGMITLSLDGAQSVGVIGDEGNLYYGIGYAGHGVTLSYLFGKVIADIFAGRDDEWKEMPFYKRRLPSYLPPEPMKYAAVKSYMSYLRFRDFAKRR